MKKHDKDEHDENASKEHYLEGAPEFQDTLDDALDELESRSAYYRRRIIQRAMAIRAEAEWKLRKKSPDKPKPTPTPTTPKAPSTTPSKPRADHGEAPQAPAGQSYYWAEPSKGGQHE